MGEPTCENCGAECEVTTSNSVFVYFESEPFYSFILVSCSCLTKSRVFYKVEEHPAIVEFGLAVVHFPFAPEPIKEQWLNLYCDEPEYVDECFGVGKTVEIDPDAVMDEVVVANFHDWLEGVSPDEFG